jgi:Spy/CpxP family protein refolding chaperone
MGVTVCMRNDNKKNERRIQMRKHLIVTITLLLSLGLMQSPAFAEKRGGHGQGRHHQKSIQEKFFKKVKMIHRYQDELNVTDDQLNQTRELKITLKKDLIKKKADIEIISVDIRSLLYEDKVDVNAVNKLIDQKYEIKKSKMKMVVKSLSELKKILSKEQMEKLKSIAYDKRDMKISEGPPMRGMRH